ncbi:hypothetical protein ACOMHN_021562 [Nucella lapillus]
MTESSPPANCPSGTETKSVAGREMAQKGKGQRHRFGHLHDTPLFRAALSGDVANIKSVKPSQADVDAKSSTMKLTPLHVACHHGHFEVVQVLLDLNADINMQDTFGFTPLYKACHGQHLEVVKLLIARGADTNLSNTNSSTPLLMACYYGHYSVARELLSDTCGSRPDTDISFNTDVGARCTNGMTPLHLACLRGHLAVVQLLVENYANVHATSQTGSTPLVQAVKSNHEKVVKYLLQHRPRLAVEDPLYPLHYAVFRNNTQLVELLLNSGVDVNKKYENRGITCLHYACQTGADKMVSLLLKYGANVNARDDKGGAPVHYAATNPANSDILLDLFVNKADLNAEDSKGRTALHRYYFRGDEFMKNVLDSSAEPLNLER